MLASAASESTAVSTTVVILISVGRRPLHGLSYFHLLTPSLPSQKKYTETRSQAEKKIRECHFSTLTVARPSFRPPPWLHQPAALGIDNARPATFVHLLSTSSSSVHVDALCELRGYTSSRSGSVPGVLRLAEQHRQATPRTSSSSSVRRAGVFLTHQSAPPLCMLRPSCCLAGCAPPTRAGVAWLPAPSSLLLLHPHSLICAASSRRRACMPSAATRALISLSTSLDRGGAAADFSHGVVHKVLADLDGHAPHALADSAPASPPLRPGLGHCLVVFAHNIQSKSPLRCTRSPSLSSILPSIYPRLRPRPPSYLLLPTHRSC